MALKDPLTSFSVQVLIHEWSPGIPFARALASNKGSSTNDVIFKKVGKLSFDRAGIRALGLVRLVAIAVESK